MLRFKKKVELLVNELKRVDGVTVIMPAGTFYVFPNVAPICMRLGITSHGLAIRAPNFCACTAAAAVSSLPLMPEVKPR